MKTTGDVTIQGALDLDGDVSLNNQLFVASDISVNTISIGRGGGDISTNTVVGNDSMQANTTGSNNTSFGFNANKLLNGGNQNTAIGTLALAAAIDTNKNTAVGYNALSGSNDTGATTNTAIGANAGSNNSLGSSLTFLGADTTVNESTATYQNSTAIGAGATISASNQMVLGADGQNLAIKLNATSVTGTADIIDVNLINFTSESIPASAIVGSSSTSTALTGAVFIENTLSVDKLATFKENLSVVGGLAIGQDSTLDGDVVISGDTTMVGNMSVPQINDMLTFVTYSDVAIASGLQNATTNLSTDWTNVNTAITGVPDGQWLGGVLSETGQYQMFYNQAEPTKIYRSTNYGTSFDQKTFSGSIYDAGYSANMNNLMAIDYTGKFSVFAGNGIVEYSINNGLTYNNIATTALNSQTGTKISAVGMYGNGKTLIVGGTNSQLFVSTDSSSLVSIDASPIFDTQYNNLKSISCNGAGTYCMAITDANLYITNPGADTLYNATWDVKTDAKHADMNLANVTDSFINNDATMFGITTTNGLYLSSDYGANWTKYGQANGYNSVTYTYRRDPLIDGEYIYLTTADTGKVKKIVNAKTSISIDDDAASNATSAAHTSVIVSGHGGYTYAFTGATSSYTPYTQINTGSETVSVASGTAFVLNKDAELNMKLDVSDNVIFNKNLYLDGDASFNSNIDISGQVAIGKNTANVSLDISGNDAIRIPHGDTAARPTVTDEATHGGYIRYNDETHQFEGYGPGDSWGSLGGVINVAQNTKILAESSAAATNNELQFYTATTDSTTTDDATERMRIKADGDISMNHNLVVGGNTTINGTLDVTGDTSVSTFDSTGATSLATGNGAVNIASSGEMTTVKGTFNVDEAVTLDTTLDVTGDTSVSTFDSTGATSLATSGGVVNISKSGVMTTVLGTLNVDEAVTLDTTLDVSGATAIDNTLDVSGNFNIHTDKFQVTATSGNTAIAGTLDVTGDTTMTTTAISSTLDVSGATVIDGTLTLDGDASLNSNLSVDGDITVLGALDLDGDVSLNGKLSVASDISVNSISIGTGGGSISTNTVVGNDSMQANTTGSNNTSFGYNANKLLNGGNQNTAIGTLSLIHISEPTRPY